MKLMLHHQKNAHVLVLGPGPHSDPHLSPASGYAGGKLPAKGMPSSSQEPAEASLGPPVLTGRPIPPSIHLSPPPYCSHLAQPPPCSGHKPYASARSLSSLEAPGMAQVPPQPVVLVGAGRSRQGRGT